MARRLGLVAGDDIPFPVWYIQEVAEGPLRRMSRAGEVLMFLVVVGTQTIRGSRI